MSPVKVFGLTLAIALVWGAISIWAWELGKWTASGIEPDMRVSTPVEMNKWLDDDGLLHFTLSGVPPVDEMIAFQCIAQPGVLVPTEVYTRHWIEGHKE